MEKTYSPETIEAHWRGQWENAGYFAPQGQGQPYCIVLPPPNVTGTLHMGHGFQTTLMDTLIRYHRMLGDQTLWQVGTDHAGIATQMVVERQLAQKNMTRRDLSRADFIDTVWAWKAQSGGEICQQLRRLGASVDWTHERFTMDANYSAAVLQAFTKLYDEGLIYRGKRLVNWDPALLTAVSDLEVLSEEEEGQLWQIAYPFAEGQGQLIIATTRPETLLGDVAVAVHPEDTRYQALIGKMLKLPLCDRLIPVIADTMVDPSFGTGCVKITPAHDFNDYATGKRHDLPQINIFTPEAKINDQAPQKYQGLDRFEARKMILADLDAEKLLVKAEKHLLKIPRGDRSGVIIEPYLTDQWYVKVDALKDPAIEAVKSGKVKFIPENWDKTYFQWMENLEDWCISRQLWWGHRIPAWYDDHGQVFVGLNEAEVRQKYQLAENMALRQDEDVLDTWFSAALWPFASLGWPQDLTRVQKFYPTQVLVTGFDIIFFWVARMMMFGLYFQGNIPFHEIYITGLIRDAEGQKMSKSKGNILDPIDLIDGIDLAGLLAKRTTGLMQPQMAEKIRRATEKQFPQGITGVGTDALRFTFLSLANHNRNIRFDLGRLEGYRNFCNKLWNAARFILMHVENFNLSGERKFSMADRWIAGRLNLTIERSHQHFKDYRFDYLAQTLYDFFWHDYCDWYLELSKTHLFSQDDTSKRASLFTLISVMETFLRLLHPLMPFITEEIWQTIAPLSDARKTTSLMMARYPSALKISEDFEEDMLWLQAVILGIRNIRGELNISPAQELELEVSQSTERDAERFTATLAYLAALAKIRKVRFVKEAPRKSLSALLNGMQVHIPFLDFMNLEEEIARLEKCVAKETSEIARFTQKLASAQFTEKAPPEVVAKEREKLGLALLQKEKHQAQLLQLRQSHA